jgi:transposase
LRAFGHEPRIAPAIYVKPFVKGQKNDYNDAEAIAEAALQPNLSGFGGNSSRNMFRRYRQTIQKLLRLPVSIVNQIRT